MTPSNSKLLAQPPALNLAGSCGDIASPGTDTLGLEAPAAADSRHPPSRNGAPSPGYETPRPAEESQLSMAELAVLPEFAFALLEELANLILHRRRGSGPLPRRRSL